MKDSTVGLLIAAAIVGGIVVHFIDAAHYSKQDTQDNMISLHQESKQFLDFQTMIQGIYPAHVDCSQFGYQPDVDFCNQQNSLIK